MNLIEGLHTCNPKNTPQVGQVKSFLVTEQVSERTGRQWTKIASPPRGVQGQAYEIVTVTATGRKDAYGNVSFNLQLKPSDAQSANAAGARNRFDGAGGSGAQDSPRQHLMRAANLYRLCMAAVEAAIDPTGKQLSSDHYQAAVSSLFIESSRQGYVDKMPAKPMEEKMANISHLNEAEPLPEEFEQPPSAADIEAQRNESDEPF